MALVNDLLAKSTYYITDCCGGSFVVVVLVRYRCLGGVLRSPGLSVPTNIFITSSYNISPLASKDIAL